LEIVNREALRLFENGQSIKGNDQLNMKGCQAERASTRDAFTKKSIGEILAAFKSITTLKYLSGIREHNWEPFIDRLWHRNFFEHIIRNDDDLNHCREYIINNPLKWAEENDNSAINPPFKTSGNLMEKNPPFFKE
jgi:hypothetical protein